MNKKILSLLIILGILSLIFATADDAVVDISDPTASQVISTTTYDGLFTVTGTDFKAFNCSWYIDGAKVASNLSVKNATETTAAFTLTAGEPRATHELNVTCQNATYKYSEAVDYVQAYISAYATTDYAAIFIDTIASAVLFVKENITLIGTMLLVGFLVGGAIAIKLKAGRVF